MAKEQRFRASVRELAEFGYQRGDLRAGSAVAALPLLQGAKAHRLLQERLGTGSLAEVHYRHAAVRGEIALELSGRADIVHRHAYPEVVEELKTTRTPLLLITPQSHPEHLAQARIYAALHALTHELDAVEVRLTYVELPTLETRSFRETFSRAALLAALDEATGRYLDWLALIAFARAERDRSLSALPFPFPVSRPGQHALVDRVCRAVVKAERLFAEAPTGSGKTIAVLYGALKALSQGHAEQLVYLTARTSGRAGALTALALLVRSGASISAVELTARESVCTTTGADCTAENCPLAKGHYDRLPEARLALQAAFVANREVLEQIASAHRVCSYWLASAFAPWADVVICDYNYAFDPRIGSRVLPPDAKGRVLLVDEAHNLVERARGIFSSALRRSALREATVELGAALPEVRRALLSLSRAMTEAAASEADPRFGCPVFATPPKRFMRALERFANATETVLGAGLGALAGNTTLLPLYFEVLSFLRLVREPSAGDRMLATNDSGVPVVQLLCLDPAPRLSAVLECSCHAAVFFSATLQPTAYFAAVLAGDEHSPRLALPSPFPAEQLAAFVVSGVSTRYRARMNSVRQVAALIATTVGSRKGNYLAFFPSYEYLEQVRAAYATLSIPAEVLVQRPGMSLEAKASFLAAFRPDRSETLVAFAVQGGVFGEAIDLPGERLMGAIIVGPGLPKICRERELLRQHFEDNRGAGFEFAYLYPALTKVVQAAGRVIRSETDRGVVVLVDERFCEPRVRRLLPAWWQLGTVDSADALSRALAHFWRG